MAALSAGLAVIAAGTALRQVDRWWFSPDRGRHTPGSLRAVMSLQRERLNDVTPVFLLLGQWLGLAGWCLVAVHGGLLACAAAALAGAVTFRHLQEISHFAVHGVLARGGRLNALLAEVAVHVPLGFVPVPVRRRRHVREHHPNATVAGADPNLAELHRAGLQAGATTARCVLARGTWLPYGDLYHFAHSAHPAVRWNYLPALERSLRGPDYRPHALPAPAPTSRPSPPASPRAHSRP